jgi:hypothetical protein
MLLPCSNRSRGVRRWLVVLAFLRYNPKAARKKYCYSK